MSTRRWRSAAAAVVLAGSLTLLPVVGIAAADCTTAGDFGAGAGCAPPGGSSGSSTESWPPSKVDWPPQLNSDTGNENGGEGGGKGGSGGGGGGGGESTPIVMPSGQKPTPAKSSSGSDSTSTSTSATPIVPVGSAPAGTTASATTSTTSTPIVTPQH